jgi:hypothetical protein
MAGGVRKSNEFYRSGVWGRITEDQAKDLVDTLYKGIV